jgi:hypothetical protein
MLLSGRGPDIEGIAIAASSRRTPDETPRLGDIGGEGVDRIFLLRFSSGIRFMRTEIVLEKCLRLIPSHELNGLPHTIETGLWRPIIEERRSSKLPGYHKINFASCIRLV